MMAEESVRKPWHGTMDLWKVILYSGFAKSVTGTSFVSIGVAIIFNGMVNPGWYQHYPFVGIIAILSGAIVYLAGDWYKKRKEEEHIEILQTEVELLVEKRARELSKSFLAGLKTYEPVDSGDYDRMMEPGIECIKFPDSYPTLKIIEIGRDMALSNDIEPTLKYLRNFVKNLYKNGWISLKKYEECLDQL
jgi:hypothetical protein